MKAMVNNMADAALALWALASHPPHELEGHPDVNVANKQRFLDIAARFGSLAAMRYVLQESLPIDETPTTPPSSKQRSKTIFAKSLRYVLKPESVRNLRVFPPVYLPGELLGTEGCIYICF